MNKKNDIKGLSFEQALSELEEIVEKLEQGDIDLEDSIDIYERGNLLKAHCEKKLESAKMKVDVSGFPTPPVKLPTVNPVAPAGSVFVLLPAEPAVFCVTKTSSPVADAVKPILVPALILVII